ncbi:MAG: hypothetical protein LBE14_03620, partial [Treponema sp.]|nr:hypothetical protein [Treponema sp.]
MTRDHDPPAVQGARPKRNLILIREFSGRSPCPSIFPIVFFSGGGPVRTEKRFTEQCIAQLRDEIAE